MALFFDQVWFDAKLAETGSTRDDVGRLLRLTAEQVGELWKDQRELRADDVAVLARFLNVPASEIASRAGISTPVPGSDQAAENRIAELEGRVGALEAALRDILRRLPDKDVR